MRICLLADGYPTEGNPSFVFVQQLVDALIDRGIQIDVIAPQSITNSLIRRKPLLSFQEKDRSSGGKEYIVYRPKYISSGNSNVLNSLVQLSKKHAIKTAIKAIGIDQIDVFYAHFWHNANALKKIAKKYKKPLFVACGEGDNALEALVEGMSSNDLLYLKNAVTGVISVSSENKHKCIEHGLCDKKDIVVLPNCVNKDIFHECNREEYRKCLGISDSDYVVIFVGGFINRKGSKRLSQALTELNDKNIKAIFIGHSLGGDSYAPDYKYTIFQGAISHNDLPQYLNASDVFVLPTLKEGCCNSIVEALSCGVPVISSNGAFNDDILDEKCSIRIDPMSVSDIKEAIYKIKNDAALQKSMHLAALAKSKNWSITSRAEKIHQFIDKKIHRK